MQIETFTNQELNWGVVHCYLFAFLLIFNIPTFGQVRPDSNLISKTTEFPSIIDSLPSDSTEVDSLMFTLDEVLISSSGLDAEVKYSARDSMEYDIANQKIFLYGGGKVEYGTITLEAGFIEMNYRTNIVTAEGIPDSVGRMGEFPKFADGDQDFTAKRMRYNFKTEKGKIYNVTTQQEGLNVLGTESKIVRTKMRVPETDSIITEDIIYSRDAIFTTCNHPVPHFGIRSRKQKVIPGKSVIIGPSNLEIASIPTPLWLPFGFFPTTETQKQGFLIPSNYTQDPNWGFGLRDLGYFLPINDYLNATLTSYIYFKGTWGANATVNFRKRYVGNGTFSIGYDRRRQENRDATVTVSPSLSVRLSINQDAKAHPTIRLNGSVNLQSSGYQSVVFNDAQSVLQRSINSNLSFSQSFPGKPFNYSVAFTASQNTQREEITMNFPNFNFQTKTIYPLKRKNKSGKQQWYEQIGVRYTAELKANATGPDASFFNLDTLTQGLNAGARHTAAVNTSFKLLKYFSVTPSVNYTGAFNFRTINQDFIDAITIERDTVFNPADSSDFVINEFWSNEGMLVRDTAWGVSPIHEYRAGISLNTVMYGTISRPNGKWFRGIRHTAKPSISMNWSPDYARPSLGYVQEYVRQTSEGVFDTIEYSPFSSSLYRAPTSSPQWSLNYNVSNIFEAKIFSKKDSTEKKINLFNNIYVGGNYNFLRDSLKFSDISVSGATRLFKGLTNFNFNMSFSPYVLGENGRSIDKFYWNTNQRPLRFVNARFVVSSNLTLRQIIDWFKGEADEQNNLGGSSNNTGNRTAGRSQNNNPNDVSLADWLNKFSFRHNYTFNIRRQADGSDTLIVNSNSIDVRGNIQLSPNWSLNISSFGYDFKNRGLSYPYFGFSRRLHCWQLSFNWAPTRNVYDLRIAVVDAPLNFLSVPYQRNNPQSRFRGF